MKNSRSKITAWVLILCMSLGLTACGGEGAAGSVLSSAGVSSTADTDPIPVVIDTDPGIDDAFALTLAASSPKLKILAITAVQGNVPLSETSENALALADYLKLGCPVAVGAESPLKKAKNTAGGVHGTTGLGNAQLPAPTSSFDPRPAWDVIYDCASKNQGKLVIVAVGPLTNIATTLEKHPDIKSMLKQIVIMGGSAGAGNMTQYGEFNVYNDPDAAKIVFDSGIPMAMMGLDATNAAYYTVGELSGMFTEKSGVYELYRGIDDYLSSTAYRGRSLYDFVAVAWLLDPSVETTYQAEVSVTTSGTEEGRTVVTKKDGGHVAVAGSLNKSELTSVLKQMFQHYEPQ